jgi:hypothetical protein
VRKKLIFDRLLSMLKGQTFVLACEVCFVPHAGRQKEKAFLRAGRLFTFQAVAGSPVSIVSAPLPS